MNKKERALELLRLSNEYLCVTEGRRLTPEERINLRLEAEKLYPGIIKIDARRAERELGMWVTSKN